MAYQTHLFRVLDGAGSNRSATPRTDNIVRGFEVANFLVGFEVYVAAHA